MMLVPLFAVGLQFFVFLQMGSGSPLNMARFWIDQVLTFWAMLVLPSFIALECACVAGIEHRYGGWKFLFAAPRPRWRLYTAKAFACYILVGIGFVELFVFAMMAGLVLGKVRGDLRIVVGPAVGPAFLGCGLMYLASWLQISAQSWLSMRCATFAVPVALGVAVTTINIEIARSERFARLFPAFLPMDVVAYHAKHMVAGVGIGGIGGLCVLMLGCAAFIRRNF
jgi:ABC-2 type transport system permease protein